MSEQLDKKPQKKVGLGRGLDSLLGNQMTRSTGGFSENVPAQLAQTTQKPAVVHTQLELPVEQIVPNREQPRRKFSENELRELSDSIKQKGIIQPILVRKLEGNEYQIIAGERRWRAAQLAGLKRVPVIVKAIDIRETLELALIENIQRQDLNPLEEAEAYNALIEKYHLTQQQLSERVGKDRATVANVLRLVRLPKDIRDLVRDGQLSLGQAKVLLSVEDLGIQKKLARRAVRTQMSVRSMERLVKQLTDGAVVEDDEDLKIEQPNYNDKLLKDLALNLQRALGTKVDISFNGKRGSVKIDFYSVEELNGLADKLQKGK